MDASFGYALIILAAGVLLYSLFNQRKAMGRQGMAIDRMEESMELSRKAIALQEEEISLQRRQISLLEQILDKLNNRT